MYICQIMWYLLCTDFPHFHTFAAFHPTQKRTRQSDNDVIWLSFLYAFVTRFCISSTRNLDFDQGELFEHLEHMLWCPKSHVMIDATRGQFKQTVDSRE